MTSPWVVVLERSQIYGDMGISLGGKSQQFVVIRDVGISLGSKSQQFFVVRG